MINTPKLRFNQFSGDWSSRLLNNFATKITQKNGDYKVTNVISNSAKNGLISQKDYFDKDIANLDNINGYYVINDGDFVYNPRKSSESPYGPINRFSSTEAGVVSPLYLCFYVNHEVNDKYLEYYFKSSKWHQFIYRNSDQGARHDRVSIRDVEFFKMKLNIPTYQEQEKIASFFSLIDKKIELQTEKVEELKKYKKGIMQKIFSQELRFKDENGNDFAEWEEKKLGNFIVEYKEKTIIENQYPILTSSRNGLMLQTDYFKDRQVTTEDNIGYHIIPRGYITFRSRSDDTTFKFNQNNLIDKGIISYFYPVFCFNEYLNDVYALSFMNNYLGYQIRREIVGTSQLVLSLNKLKELKIPVPCIEEQNKISNILSKIDEKIEKEQTKLHMINDYKKGLLQQMFV